MGFEFVVGGFARQRCNVSGAGRISLCRENILEYTRGVSYNAIIPFTLRSGLFIVHANSDELFT